MPAIQRRSLDDPDEVREFELGRGELTHVGPHVIGRGVLQPGWRWSSHLAAVMGTPSCPIHHLHLLLSGRLGVRMDDGEEAEFAPNDFFDVPAGHDAWVVGDEPAVVLDIAGNIGAFAVPMENERAIATLLMTDIVDSTRHANRIGDPAWKQVLSDHNRLVRSQLERFRGTEIATTGDGFLASFPSAAGALRCALAIRDAVKAAGIEVRIGVHTGEIERQGTGVGGVAVHAAARIMALAGASEVLASAITVGLAEGSGLRFEDHGRHEVKGFDRPIEVLRAMA